MLWVVAFFGCSCVQGSTIAPQPLRGPLETGTDAAWRSQSKGAGAAHGA